MFFSEEEDSDLNTQQLFPVSVDLSDKLIHLQVMLFCKVLTFIEKESFEDKVLYINNNNIYKE
jgi:hypothetical protein